MTLAVIFLFGTFWTTPIAWDAGFVSRSVPSAENAQQAPKPQDTSQPQAPPADSKQAAPVSAQTPAQPAKHPPKRSYRRKKKPVDCNTSTAATPTTSGATQNSTAAANSAAQTPHAGEALNNCPPPKIVVRQGGTSEPSIQLAGGPDSNKATERATANQMLDATEANLKKIAEHQLSSTQQDTVTQIREFMEQSKTAAAAGDSDRAQKLAWKAKTLSDDLVKPQP